MKILVLSLTAAISLSSCGDRSTSPNFIKCADGLEVKVFYQQGDSMPSKIEFSKQDKVETITQDDGYLLKNVVSPDQKWIVLQESIFGDFMFCPQGQVMNSLQDNKAFSRISEKSDHAVYFSFVAWEAPCSAVISFAFNNEQEVWVADLQNKAFARRNPKGEPLFEPVFIEPKANPRTNQKH